MRKAPALIVVLVALATAGCVVSGKPGKPAAATPVTPNPVVNTAPAPPSQSLSIPQTQVELPALQPVDQAAFAPDPAPPVQITVETSTQASPGRTTPRQSSQQNAAPASNPPAANPPATPPPATTPPAEAPPPTIQEIVSTADLKRFQDQAQGRQREVHAILDQLAKRRLTPAQEDVVTNIRSLLTSSVAAEKKGDMKLADALAERAQVLAKDMVNAK